MNLKIYLISFIYLKYKFILKHRCWKSHDVLIANLKFVHDILLFANN